MADTRGDRRLLRRTGPVALLLALSLGAGACTSGRGDDNGSPRPTPSPSPSPSALSTTIPPLPADPPTTPATLGAFMLTGLTGTGYARITFSTALSGNALSGAGRVRLADGQVTGLDAQDKMSGIGEVHLLLVENVPYAALPEPTKPGKPYVVLGRSGDDGDLVRAALGLRATELLAAPATYRTLVTGATALTLVGRETVGTSPALHYRGPVDVSKIAATDQVRLALGALSVSKLHLDLWVDGAGRPLKAAAPAPDGRTSDVTFTDINQPFDIAKPPAAQVDGGS